MKRYVLLVGGTGARLADALIVAASAGAFPAEKLEVLLADTDRRGVRSANLVSAKMADYARVHQAMQGTEGPFRTDMAFSSWPESLPEDASSLSQFTAGSEEDALLCQALFDQDAAALDLHEGFHGRAMLGQVTFAGLLHEADQMYDDVLSCLVDDMNVAAQDGEEVRVVLAGSIAGGTGAAGIAALTRYIRQRTEDKVHIGHVLLCANDDQQDAVQAHESLKAYAKEDLCDTVCVIGLPSSSRATAPAEYAHISDWLGVYCMDVLLHRPQWFKGVFTVKAPAGPLSWDIFGKAAERYRLCYGGLMKTALLWTSWLSARVEKGLAKPNVLRDGLWGWYAHFFRKMEADREDQLDMLAPLGRLMNVCQIWLGGVCKTLPIDLKHASVLDAARQEAEAHYSGLTDLASRLAVMDDDAQRSELYEDNQVFRGKNNNEAAEVEAAIKRIAAAKQELNRRSSAQVALNRRLGGTAALDMHHTAQEAAQQEFDELHERYDEAVRRIDHAESIAADVDQYRITDARTKLKRLERQLLMGNSKLRYITEDVARATAEGLRFDKPAMAPAAVENSMFLPEMGNLLFQRDKLNRKAIDSLWADMVCPGTTRNIKQTLKAIRRAPVNREEPLTSLIQALVLKSMKEV